VIAVCDPNWYEVNRLAEPLFENHPHVGGFAPLVASSTYPFVPGPGEEAQTEEPLLVVEEVVPGSGSCANAEEQIRTARIALRIVIFSPTSKFRYCLCMSRFRY
jgi:hypothetical protein